MMPPMHSFLEGFFLQASLILALGAQNLFVLESGLKGRRPLWVAFVCSLCDALLIALGVFGAASIFIAIPWLKISFGFLGVLFLFFYGFKKIKESFSVKNLDIQRSDYPLDLQKIILAALGFSLLNPHVYLDTVILIGGYSSRFAGLQERLLFGVGATSFSVLWFYGLALFAFSLSRFLHKPSILKIISFVAGVVLVLLSIKLAMDIFQWL